MGAISTILQIKLKMSHLPHVGYTGCPRMFYTVFQKNIKNIESTISLIIILVIEYLICALPTVKISFTYLNPLRCDMVSLKNDE